MVNVRWVSSHGGVPVSWRERNPRRREGGGRLRRGLLAGTAVIAGSSAATPAAQAQAPGRAYEMVSPVSKSNGGVVFGHRASDDGNAVAFLLNAATGPDDGAFALTPHIAHRTPSGWTSRSAAPPIRAEHRGTSEVSAWFTDVTEDWSEVIYQTNDPVDPSDSEPIVSGQLGIGFDLYRFDPLTRDYRWLSRPVPALAAEYSPGGPSAAYTGRSRDSRHIAFTTSRRLVPEAPVVDYSLTIPYEWADGEIRLVSILPDGTPYDGWAAPAGPQRFLAQPRANQAVSEDGSRIFWTTVGNAAGDALYLRENGQRTFVVSASRATGSVGDVAPGRFLGAARDGSRVYFHSTAQLTDDPAAAAGGIYRWERDGQQLTFLAFADGMDFLTYVGPTLSERNERLYFMTLGTALTPDAIDWVPNLYVWDGSGVRLVAPVSMDGGQFIDPRLRVTRDGRFAAFTTTQSLDPRHVDGTIAIYRYDLESGTLACASCRTDGQPTAGLAEFSPAYSRYTLLADGRNVAARNFTADGRLFFETTDPLVVEDTNGVVDVYEFDGSSATLISSGSGDGAELVDNSEDGRSVFFVTAEALLPRDTDGGFPDVYVAREGGGFPEPDQDGRAPCDGDACQGLPTPPPLFAPPASSFVEPPTPAPPRPSVRFSASRPSARQLRRFAARGQVQLRFTVSAPGSLIAELHARVGRRERRIARAARRVPRAGTVALSLRLSDAARRQLSARGTLRITVAARFSPAPEARSMTLVLRAPTPQRGGRGAR